MFSEFIGMKLEDVKRILFSQSVLFSIIENDSNVKGNEKLVVNVKDNNLYVESFLLDIKD